MLPSGICGLKLRGRNVAVFSAVGSVFRPVESLHLVVKGSGKVDAHLNLGAGREGFGEAETQRLSIWAEFDGLCRNYFGADLQGLDCQIESVAYYLNRRREDRDRRAEIEVIARTRQILS